MAIADIIEIIIFLAGIVGTYIKLYSEFRILQTKHDKLQDDYDKAYQLFCSKNAKFEQQLDEESRATDSVIQTIMSQLSGISVSLAELKTDIKYLRQDNIDK